MIALIVELPGNFFVFITAKIYLDKLASVFNSHSVIDIKFELKKDCVGSLLLKCHSVYY